MKPVLKTLGCLLLLMSTSQTNAQIQPAQTAEMRGAWIDRSSLVSREEIRTTMRQLAAANFNLALVNVWSRGYPLWPSKVFERETGLLVDPGYVGRDVLREAIEEARDAGIHVMPWVEYGFIGGYTGYFPGRDGKGVIFDRHPEWLAQTKTGETRFTAPGGFFYWMVKTRPDVQAFVFDLMEELARNYQTAGIQFDRARYPVLECGYDDFTIELYRREHNGVSPPQNHTDAEWVRWRSDKINAFISELYRRIKAVNRPLLVSNAPIVFPYSYVNFAQDYTAWMRAGAMDFVNVQIYRRTAAEYEAELNRQLAAIPSRETFVPGIDITNSGDPNELIRMIELTRAKGLPGVVVWYYRGMLQAGAFPKLKQTVFAEKAKLPWAFSNALPQEPRATPRISEHRIRERDENQNQTGASVRNQGRSFQPKHFRRKSR